MLFMIKVIDGVRKRVARLTYSNGTTVERVYPIVGDVPEDVRVITASVDARDTKPYNPHVHDHIVNQEYLQYQYHFGTH
jgi:hypothetical protein